MPAAGRAPRRRARAAAARAAQLAEPVLVGVPEGIDVPPPGLLHGLYWLVANLADETPVAVVVDDAHWADEPSLRFLAYLARRVDALQSRS